MSVRHVVSVSGGKDSTATLLIALERFGRERVTPIFCDTGNEHQAVYDYLAYLESALDVRIERLAPRLDVYRPIVDWTAQQVFEFCASRGIRPNPLYLQGMGRVGCMPCINAGKAEIAEIARRFPEHIERIAAWERLVSAGCKHGFSSFFHKIEKPGADREQFDRNRVESIVMWARTTRGGRQFDLLEALAPSAGCASSYGLCEAAT